MDADKCLALPEDLLIDIFRCLETTTVIRCAGVCRPWRRAIIANVSCLRPCPDRFLPDLLLGFLDKYSRFPKRLQYVPASSNTDVPSLLTPASRVDVGVCVNGRLYNNLLSSRDGVLLLGEDKGRENLCLCTALTGACKVLPAAALFDDIDPVGWMYVLATGYDVEVEDHSGDEAAVWILAVKWLEDFKDGMRYQIFSSTSGAWGPVRCSAKFPEDVAYALTESSSSRGVVVVCHGAVSWFVLLFANGDVVERSLRKCMFSVDLRTGRTWTTELPDLSDALDTLALAVSEDGQLSLARMLLSRPRMEVWVLVGDSQWMLRRTIDHVQKLLPDCPSMRHMLLSGFCPGSGYLFGFGSDEDDRDLHHHFVIGVDGSSPRLIGSVESRNSATRFPYEMDCSTYISKMKYF